MVQKSVLESLEKVDNCLGNSEKGWGMAQG